MTHSKCEVCEVCDCKGFLEVCVGETKETCYQESRDIWEVQACEECAPIMFPFQRFATWHDWNAHMRCEAFVKYGVMDTDSAALEQDDAFL